MEVLKLAEFQIIVTSCAVCSTWYHAASAEELYQEKCEDEIFEHRLQPSYTSAKAMYKSYLKTQTQIVRVTSTTISFFSCKTRKWSETVSLHREVQVNDSGSAWVLLPDGHVLCCGGADFRELEMLSDVYLLMSGGNVIELTPMNDRRSHHGCIVYQSVVYVFGGSLQFVNEPSHSSEKLEIQTWPISKAASWKRLPDMLHPRYFIHPCRCGNDIYLVSQGSAEMFHCDTETYTLLSLTLSPVHHTFPVSYKGEIVILQPMTVCRWDLERAELISIQESIQDCIDPIPASIKVFGDSFFFRDYQSRRVRVLQFRAGVLTHSR